MHQLRASRTGEHGASHVADGIMLAVVALWATNSVLTKAALDDGLSPLVYVFLRFVIVVVVVFTAMKFRGHAIVFPRADLLRLVITGLSGFAIYNLLFVIGLSRTSAFSAAILVGLAPIFTLIIAATLKLEPVRIWQWLGVIVSMAGVAIFLGGKLMDGEPASGDLLNILAAFSFAVYGLATKDLVIRYGAATTTAWSVLVALIAVLPFTLPAVAREDWRELGTLSWVSVLYAAVISMLIAYSLWGWAIARSGAGRTVPYLFLVPILTGIFSVLFLDERLSPAQLIGGAIVLVGVALARRKTPLQGARADETGEPGAVPERRDGPKPVPGP